MVVRTRRLRGAGRRVDQVASQVSEGGVLRAQLPDGEGAGAAAPASVIARVHCADVKQPP